MDKELNRVVFGNTVLSYILVAGGILLLWIVWRLTKKHFIVLLRAIAARTKGSFDDLAVEASEKFVLPFIYLIANYNLLKQLNMSIKMARVFEVAAMVVTTYFAVRLINFIIQHLVVTGMRTRNETDQRIKQVQGMLGVLKAVIWCGGIVMLADNIGYNVTTVIAGLGVGGIAIALAAQSILADLFSYIVIFFDRPFEIGDFIIANGYSGTVEKIGIKTSHVRSLDGQQLIMPNTEMVKSVIQNYKRLERRRVVFSIGIVYNTQPEKLRAIPSIIKGIIQKESNVTFDNCHFKSFAESSINYETVYFVDSADYGLYMDIHERICMNIFESFAEQKIDFAFPTQTVFLHNTEKAERGNADKPKNAPDTGQPAD
jgi:small-conductance mechanosensitive channel